MVALVAGLTGACGDNDNAGAASNSGSEARASRTPQPTATPTPTREPLAPVAVEPRLPSRTLTYEDQNKRFRMTFPADWHVASRHATTRINDMAGNLTAVATFPIRPRQQDACSNTVDEPRVEVGDTDALVMVGHDLHSRADGARKRPRSFRLFEQVSVNRPVLFTWRCRAQVGISGFWMTFGDSGRVFTVVAIIGKDASAKTQSETLAAMNSMEFWKR